MTLRSEVRDAHRAKGLGRSDQWTRDRQKTVALERDHGALRAAALADQRLDFQGLVLFQLLEDLAAGAAFEEQPGLPELGDARMTLTFDPGAGRHGRADRVASAASVILRDPERQRDDIGRQERLRVEDVDHRLDGVVVCGRVDYPGDHTGDDAPAQRHEHTGADHWVDRCL